MGTFGRMIKQQPERRAVEHLARVVAFRGSPRLPRHASLTETGHTVS